MIVTLDVFSGRPNPQWRLSEEETASLLHRISERFIAPEDAAEGVLGYRGLIVSATRDDQLPEGTPSSFRVGGLLRADHRAPKGAGRPLTADETDDAVRWLLSTGRNAVDPSLLAYVEDVVQLRKQGKAPEEPPGSEEVRELEPEEDADRGFPLPPFPGPFPPVCIKINPPYNPAFWNAPNVRPYNNCYNYATNYRSDTFAQPGRISGHLYTAIDCSHVSAAAKWDGLRSNCVARNAYVALAIWPPGCDYHWYRQDASGSWSHKPGGTAVQNKDQSGNPIDGTQRTPQNCNRGPYTVFCGYLWVPAGTRVR
ncbi:MAG: hypothetical protein ABFD77_10425 [Thermotogota bacterium]